MNELLQEAVSSPTRVLLVEDNAADARYVKEMLPANAYKIRHVTCLSDAHDAICDRIPEIVLLDLSLPDGDGLASFLSLLGHAPAIPIVILTALNDEAIALEAMGLGAEDYILKQEINERVLARGVRYAIERKKAEAAVYKSATLAREAEAVAKEAESQAREAEANLTLALKVSQTGVWSWNIAKNEMSLDDQAKAMLGRQFDSDSNSFESFRTIIASEDRDFVSETFEAAVKSNGPFDVEFRIGDEGCTRYISAAGNALYDASGTATKLAGVCRDITSHKEQEKNVKRLLILEKHEDFIATLTHDLKNPLIGAARLFDLLIGNQFGQLTAEQFSMLNLMKDSNADLLALIANLLEVYRYDEGAPPLHLVEIEMTRMVGNCLKQLTPVAQISGVQLHSKFVGEDQRLCVDEIAIRRLLMNLLGNGIKFTPPGGSVTVSGKHDANNYLLEIADTGLGIPESDLDQLFQRFSQGTQGKEHSDGTGLGLYLCKQIVDVHQGKITCSSSAEIGTTFSIILPNTPSPKAD